MKPNAPYWDVTLEDICSYNIGDYEENMLSLAFKFTKVKHNIRDNFGLLKKMLPGNEAKTEEDLAIEMLDKSKSIRNVDELLQSDQALRNKVIGQTGRLLEKSGYSIKEYSKWANSQFNNFGQTVVVS